MFPGSSLALLTLMKPSSVDNGKTNESLSGIKEQNVGEGSGSNRSSEFSVETKLFGLKLLMMSKLKHFFLSSQKKGIDRFYCLFRYLES
jgi:hypothetical protein